MDARSDIFALGVLLYEMASGQRPFKGDTSLSTLAAIMRDTPKAVTDLNPSVPKELWRVIRRALSKDPERRQQSGKDLRNELEELRRELESGELASSLATAPTAPAAAPAVSSTLSSATTVQHRRAVPRWAIAAGLVAVATAGGWLWRVTPESAATDRSLDEITVASVVSVTSEDGVETFPSLSPDGRWLVYAADELGTNQTDILLRAVGGQTVINLTKDSPADDTQPAFSPDGERIAFRSARDGGGIFVMGRTGESVRRLTSEGFTPTWAPDGATIAYVLEGVGSPMGRSTASTLWTVTVSAGDRRQLQVRDAMQPAWSPHGHRIAYWGLLGDSVQRDLWTVAPSGGDPVRLTDDAAVDWSPAWSPDGRFVYYSSDRTGQFNVWRIGVDEATGRPLGTPTPVTLPRQNLGHLTFAADGVTLAATSLNSQSNIELLTYDAAKGAVTGRRRVTNVSENTQEPSLSRDGQSIVFFRVTNGQEDLWVVGRDGSALRRLTNDVAHDRMPAWMPDGRRILFYSDRGGRHQVWTMAVDGSDLRQITDYPGIVIQPRMRADGGRAVAQVPLAAQNFLFDPGRAAADQTVEQLPAFPGGFTFRAHSWSPDGRRIAGWPVQGGGIFVYDVARREYEQVLSAGTAPVWMPDGKRLLFLPPASRTLAIVDVQTRAVRPIFSSEREEINSADFVDRNEIIAVITNRQVDIVMAKLASAR